jgi:hypothetical protein
MSFEASASLLAGGLFIGMLLLYEVGRRIGVAGLARDPGGVTNGSGPAEAAIFGLLGLLLAFTFSGAASRFEERRHLVAEEANAIGTAYLRVDLVSADAQPALLQLFSHYLDTRLETFRSLADVAATKANLSATDALQRQIWSRALSTSQQPGAAPDAEKLLLPALNQMFDIATTRTMATHNHPPTIIFCLLAGLSLLSALLIGYVMCNTSKRSWFYLLLVSATMSTTFYVILDLEYPRLGLIRVDAADQVLMDLRKSMGQ